MLAKNSAPSKKMAGSMTTDAPSLWRSRGYIPHWEAGETAQMIGFRLFDSLPAAVLERWTVELGQMPDDAASVERRKRIELALDSGHGEAWLNDARIAGMVESAFLHFDGERYRLCSWVVMPNQAHVVAVPLGNWTLADIVHSWKSFTAKEANSLLNRSGSFWSREYFDRVIRDENHYANALDYVANNPVKARLCATVEEWRYSSKWRGRTVVSGK